MKLVIIAMHPERWSFATNASLQKCRLSILMIDKHRTEKQYLH